MAVGGGWRMSNQLYTFGDARFGAWAIICLRSYLYLCNAPRTSILSVCSTPSSWDYHCFFNPCQIVFEVISRINTKRHLTTHTYCAPRTNGDDIKSGRRSTTTRADDCVCVHPNSWHQLVPPWVPCVTFFGRERAHQDGAQVTGVPYEYWPVDYDYFMGPMMYFKSWPIFRFALIRNDYSWFHNNNTRSLR